MFEKSCEKVKMKGDRLKVQNFELNMDSEIRFALNFK